MRFSVEPRIGQVLAICINERLPEWQQRQHNVRLVDTACLFINCCVVGRFTEASWDLARSVLLVCVVTVRLVVMRPHLQAFLRIDKFKVLSQYRSWYAFLQAAWQFGCLINCSFDFSEFTSMDIITKVCLFCV